VNFTAAVSGTVKRPQAQVNLIGSNLSAYGESLGNLSTYAQLANDVVTINNSGSTKHQARRSPPPVPTI